MRPLQCESLPGFMLIRTCSPFLFDLASTEYPQRLAPHCSIRTLPSFSSVSQTPSGVVSDGIAAVCCFCTGADTGAVATTGAGAGVAAGAESGATCAGALAGGCIAARASAAGATFAVAVEGAEVTAAGV